MPLPERIRWRISTLRTMMLRRIRPSRSPEEQLRQHILERCRKLGIKYEDGNSDIAGYTYHPIYFSGFEQIKSHRANCELRLSAIRKEIDLTIGDWVLDVGANVGFFSFGLEESGAMVEAYETNSLTFEIGAALAKLYQKNVIYINKSLSLKSLHFLRPRYKTVLLLSVFHWIMKQEGESAAIQILHNIAQRAESIFLETPTSPDEAMYRNPNFSSKESVIAFIQKCLPNATICELCTDTAWGNRSIFKITP